MEDQNLFLDDGGQEPLFHLNYIDEKTKSELRKKNFILTIILYVLLSIIIITMLCISYSELMKKRMKI